MIVSSTELQNNFGKYLMLAAREDVFVSRNGTIIARLSAAHRPGGEDAAGVAERAQTYGYGGRRGTYEEFLELTRDTEVRYEFIDGEIYLLSSPKTAHQAALSELHVIFYNYFAGKKCTPMMAPYDITLSRTGEDINIVQPDLMVICDLEEKLNEKDYYMGVPDLLLEILSQSTRGKDLIKKLDLYMSCGVNEYWIVNPLNKEVTVYQFAGGDICDNITFKEGETANSFIFPGLTADLNGVFRR